MSIFAIKWFSGRIVLYVAPELKRVWHPWSRCFCTPRVFPTDSERKADIDWLLESSDSPKSQWLLIKHAVKNASSPCPCGSWTSEKGSCRIKPNISLVSLSGLFIRPALRVTTPSKWNKRLTVFPLNTDTFSASVLFWFFLGGGH